MNKSDIIVKDFATSDYQAIFTRMQAQVNTKTSSSIDELWVGEHKPCYTQGIRSHQEQPFIKNSIPVYASNRGGQMTYHGPGQLILYPFIHLESRQLNLKSYVHALESMMIAYLNQHHIACHANPEAPGIYLSSGEKIASLGIRIKNHWTYHGIAINIDMDLSPFHAINPCGLENMQMAQLKDLISPMDKAWIKKEIVSHFCAYFGYTNLIHEDF